MPRPVPICCEGGSSALKTDIRNNLSTNPVCYHICNIISIIFIVNSEDSESSETSFRAQFKVQKVQKVQKIQKVQKTQKVQKIQKSTNSEILCPEFRKMNSESLLVSL